jgi:hypothetical protein
MMHISQPSGSTSNASNYRQIFVHQVHQLLQLGFERLTPAAHANEQEPAITGFLVEAINNVLSDCARKWMKQFSVHDDPPVNDGIRKGKKRKRVDIRIDSANFRPRARFQFEAKRLSKNHRVTAYLGSKGLGCFLRGDYAKGEDEAGMLGYVQTGDFGDWGTKIGNELANRPDAYSVDPVLLFSAHSIPLTKSLMSYRSQHKRSTVGRPIIIVHSLLKFH